MTYLSWKPEKLNENKPLYLAIADALEDDIRNGILAVGQQLPPQRELADLIGVNVSTIARALRESQRRGLLSGTVGRGTFVSADINVPVSMYDNKTFRSTLLELGLVNPLCSIDSEIKAFINTIWARTDITPFLSYNNPAGILQHREAAAQWLQKFGLETNSQNIIVTSGSQNAIACSLMSLFKAGDYLAVDQFTYPGLKTLAAMLGIRLVPVHIDEQGTDPQFLETICRRDPIRGLYIMPECHNPTTAYISDERREQIASIIKKYNLVFIEDDSYRFNGRLDHPPLSNSVPGNSIYIAGISKILVAGLRINFISAEGKLRNQVESAILNTAWMASPITSEVVSQLLSTGIVNNVLNKRREDAVQRTELTLSKLAPFNLQSRKYGSFVWLKLPSHWKTGREFELAAAAAGIKVLCAERFTVGSDPVPAAIRIAQSGPETLNELECALDILLNTLMDHNKGALWIY